MEQLIECDSSADFDAGHADCGIFGGWPYLALQYVISAGGLRSDDDMPYCAGVEYGEEGSCSPCMPTGYSTLECGDYDDDFQIPLYCDKNSTLGQSDTTNLCSSTTGFAMTISDWKAVTSDESEIADTLVRSVQS